MQRIAEPPRGRLDPKSKDWKIRGVRKFCSLFTPPEVKRWMFHPGKSQGMDRSHKNDSRTSLGKQLLLLSVPRDVPKAADSDLEFSRTFWSWGNSAWILFSLARDGFYCLQDALMCSTWSFLVLKKNQTNQTNPTQPWTFWAVISSISHRVWC